MGMVMLTFVNAMSSLNYMMSANYTVDCEWFEPENTIDRMQRMFLQKFDRNDVSFSNLTCTDRDKTKGHVIVNLIIDDPDPKYLYWDFVNTFKLQKRPSIVQYHHKTKPTGSYFMSTTPCASHIDNPDTCRNASTNLHVEYVGSLVNLRDGNKYPEGCFYKRPYVFYNPYPSSVSADIYYLDVCN
ncbi:hypothetical protein [Emiliania huxleyi virus 99B1]|nr:hypothetical protein [Emiliania huxleyi virus 99B1]